MGESPEGSSSAAHGAQDSDISQKPGFFGRLAGVFSGGTADASEEGGGGEAAPAPSVSVTGPRGMANLRRMRVEDGMIADQILRFAEEKNVAVLGFGPASEMAGERPGT